MLLPIALVALLSVGCLVHSHYFVPAADRVREQEKVFLQYTKVRGLLRRGRSSDDVPGVRRWGCSRC
jgi:hypothetical protein